MTIDLFKIVRNSYIVKDGLGKTVTFSSIDDAADHLEKLGVKDEEIDFAISTMVVSGHTHAKFGEIQGSFISSDNEPLSAHL